MANNGTALEFLRIKDIQFAAIDFESAGSQSSLADEPVQIGISHLCGTKVSRHFVSYLSPQKAVTWTARIIHGISDEQLVGAPRLVDLWPQIKSAMQDRWIVAHGAATEKRFLRIFPFHGFSPWLDTLVLARAIYPTLASHALGDIIHALELDKEPEICTIDFRWHDASCDSVASLVLLRHLIKITGLAEAPAAILKHPNLKSYFSYRKAQCLPS